MTRTAINLYSVRDLDDPTLDILSLVADAGYDGVQFSGGLGDVPPSEVRDALEDLGLEVTPPHVGIERLEDDLDAVLETYVRTLGCDGMVVPYLDAAHFADATAVDATAERLQSLASTLDDHDLDLHYHNHAHEFTAVGEETGFERLIESTDDVLFELDVGWVRTGGADPVALIDRFGERMPLIHMKDMTDDGEFAEIGEGVVDMQACADAARNAGAEWLMYEHDEPANPRESIATGAEVLDSLSADPHTPD